MDNDLATSSSKPSHATQRGAVMLITLITLTLVMMSAMALIRSFETSLSMAGNLAFKRDLVNQAERGIAQAISLFESGGALSAQTDRESDSNANNYRASMFQPTNSQGIPQVLLSDTAFTNSGLSAADITDNQAGVTVRYVIDRLCSATGPATSTGCMRHAEAQGGSVSEASKRASTYRPIYRISVRATGPRNSQVYLQTTISR